MDNCRVLPFSPLPSSFAQMRFLFIHQNFPGQFLHVARALADNPAHEVIGIGEAANIQGRPALHPRVRVLGYPFKDSTSKETHRYIRDFEIHIRRAQALTQMLTQLRDSEGFVPDVILAHTGWGEGLFLREVFPGARILNYCEYYYQGQGGDMGFDREFPQGPDAQFRIRIKNSTQIHSLLAADGGISPTRWQQSLYPAEFRPRINIIHEGIDTALAAPDPQAWLEIRGQRFQVGDETVTYVARNLEPYRGFHTFMRSLSRLQALRPQARVIIVGGNDVSYGQRLPPGQSYRKRYCSEVQNQVDWSRVFFVGKLPYKDYLRVLQVSAAHVYLTYPFVLSWSMLEAMSVGCLLIGSRTAPVQEVIEDGQNGLLTDFFDPQALADTIAQALAQGPALAPLRQAARQTIVERYDLTTRCLPEMLALLEAR